MGRLSALLSSLSAWNSGIVLECLHKRCSIIAIRNVNDVNSETRQAGEISSKNQESHNETSTSTAGKAVEAPVQMCRLHEKPLQIVDWCWTPHEKIHQLSYVRIREISREKSRLSGYGWKEKASFFTFECYAGDDRDRVVCRMNISRNGTNNIIREIYYTTTTQIPNKLICEIFALTGKRLSEISFSTLRWPLAELLWCAAIKSIKIMRNFRRSH